METRTVADEGGRPWLMVLGCPLNHKHSIKDQKKGDSGPTVAACSACEYQRGLNVELPSGDGIGVDFFNRDCICKS